MLIYGCRVNAPDADTARDAVTVFGAKKVTAFTVQEWERLLEEYVCNWLQCLLSATNYRFIQKIKALRNSGKKMTAWRGLIGS